MMIVERYRPNDDIAIETLNFGDIAYLAWNLYAKQEANRNMGSGDIQWIGLVDINDKAQKYIKEGYDVMKGVDSNVDLSKPGFDRLVLSGTIEAEDPKENRKGNPKGDLEGDPEEKPSKTTRQASKPTPTEPPQGEGEEDPAPSPTPREEEEDPKPTRAPGKEEPTPAPTPPREEEPAPTPAAKDDPKPSPTPERTLKDGKKDNPDDGNKRRRGVRVRPNNQNSSLQKRQKDPSKEKQIEIDVYNALLAIPSVREFTFMCVQKRAQLDHRSINLILTQPNRRSDDNSVIDIQMLLRVSLE
ncbi:uncharacterized protein DFL_001910 [Arthrobotrys flagrans]|nr:hypothetical protein DFL_001910 [Arthrobotrys flagrans]